MTASRLIVGCALVLAVSSLSAQRPVQPQSKPPVQQPAQHWPLTVPESSDYQRTSKVAEIHSYMEALKKAAPALVHYAPPNAPAATEAGKPLLAWRLPATGKDPIKVYVNANIHAGEVEGKEAIQVVIREILQGKHPEIRQSIELVTCPAYNADGTDALDPANRTRQPNPKSGVGPRENPLGLDLNRDMMKAATANTKWMLAMYRDFDPDCVMDLHATNGSRHGFYITYAPAQCIGSDSVLAGFNRRMMVGIRERLKEIGMPTYDYGNFRLDDDRRPVAFETEPVRQGMVSNYPALGNRLGVLVETFIYRSFEDRIRDNVRFILETLEWMAQHHEEVHAELRAAAKRWDDSWKNGPPQLPLKSRLVQTETYNFAGFEFAKDENGNPLRDEMGRYIGDMPVTRYTLPSFVTLEWTDFVQVPHGYLIDRAYADKVQPLLEAHGVKVLPGAHRPKGGEINYFFESNRQVSPGAYQGVFTLTLEGKWAPEPPLPRTAYAWEPEDLDNALYVPINQKMGRLAFYLLDPRAPDGLVFWGVFNSSFIRGPGMWGEGPRCPILAVTLPAHGPK